MKVVILLGLFFLSSFVFTQIDAHIDFIKSTNSKKVIAPRGISNDKEGNLYITGLIADSAVFNNVAYFSKGDGDIYLAKYSPLGDIIWVRTAGGLKFDETFDVVTNDNKVFISGMFKDSINFASDSSWNGLTLYADALNNCFIACYDLNGGFQWAKRFGENTTLPWRSRNMLAVDNQALYVTTNFMDSINFNSPSNWSINNIQALDSGNQNVCLLKYSLNGDLLWVKHVYNQNFQNVNKIVVEGPSIYVSGFFKDTVYFDFNGNENSALISIGGLDAYIAKYSLDGNFIWARRAGGFSSDYGDYISVIGDEVYLAGVGIGNINFNTPSQVGVNEIFTDNEYISIYIAKFDSDGNYKWATIAKGFANILRGVKANETGVYLTGDFETGMSFGLDAINNQQWNIYPQGNFDMFLFKVGKDGEIQWTKRGGGWSSDYSKGITLANNKIYNIGVFYSKANFNTPAAWGNNEISANSLGTSDDNYLVAYYESALGLDEKANKNNGFLVYPNPNTGSFSLKVNNNSNIQEISLLDNIGRKIETLNPKSTHFDLKLGKGVYFLEVITDVGRGLEKVVVE